jgi:dihydrofolate synthase/folylpolyglutamate synthase
MQGKHQWINATLAIYIAEYLDYFNFQVSNDDIEIGIANTRHKGRLEFYAGFLFDGAHNISGAQALRDYLVEFVNRTIVMIFGSMREKDLTEIGAILFPKADKLILTKPDNPRSMEVDELEKFIPPEFAKENVFLSENVFNALKKAKEISTENDLILVTGSLYLIGEVQKILKINSEF